MNAKKEFLKHQKQVGSKVVCAKVMHFDSYYEEPRVSLVLSSGYSEDEYSEFLAQLEFEYDAGYGSQELFGLILFSDGSFSRRAEYDGAEAWENIGAPSIEDVMEYFPFNKEE